MRTADERIAAVHSRSRRLRRRRGDRVLVAFVVPAAFLFVGITGTCAMGDSMDAGASGGGLFGATSLLGASAGGYVLVAAVSFAVAVLLTVFLMTRRHSARKEDDDAPENGNGK